MGWTLSAGTSEMVADLVAGKLSTGETAKAGRHGNELARLAPHLSPDRFRWARVIRDAIRMRF